MELRRMTLWLALFVMSLAAISQCSGGHAVQKRETNNYVDYSDPALADEASDDEAQNDDNADVEEDEMAVNVSIVSRPTTYNATAGQSVRLECKLESASILNPNAALVQWSGNNKTYWIASVKTINDDRYQLIKSDLVINNVNSSDSGSYFCDVLQNNGARIQHNLIVMEAPQITSFSAANNGHVTEKSSITLTCDVTGTPPAQIMWSKSHKDMEGKEFNEKLSGPKYIFTHKSVTIQDITREDAGTYYCYAINSLGHSQKAVKVFVDAIPRVHVPRTVVNSDYNVTAVLQCIAHEEPVPHIYWFKDGTHIENIEEYYSITTDGPTSNLTIKPRVESDFGVYTCEARNAFGAHRSSARLVQAPVVAGLRAAGAALAWSVASRAPLTQLQLDLKRKDSDDDWQTIDVPLPSSNEHEHLIRYTINEQDFAAGSYEARVKAQNTHQKWSEQDESAIITIGEKAQPIQQSSVFGAGSNGNKLYTSVMSTLLIYLLVRMF